MLLVIDNYDSFTYNLVQYFGELGERPVVHRNDALSLSDIAALSPEAIIVSPGPCSPREAGISVEVIQRFGATIPMLGVCLGHQAIGHAFGGVVTRAQRVMHGKRSLIVHEGTGLFEGVPSPLGVMRYHSLIVERASLPECLEVTATTVDAPDEIQALRHRHHPIWGVQFHPESILTDHGRALLVNFLAMARAFRGSSTSTAAR
jgi:anthranilate synthase/aminodeoxychorismate synthase-like glutamine amidotransferase